MRYKPKSIRSALIIVAIIATLAIAAGHFGVGTMRSGLRVGYIGNDGWRTWSARYSRLDGKLTHAIHPKDMQSTLHMEIVTQEGSISIEVRNSDGKTVFDDEGIGTESIDIGISGKVIVIIEAEKHKGSFNIKATEWRAEAGFSPMSSSPEEMQWPSISNSPIKTITPFKRLS